MYNFNKDKKIVLNTKEKRYYILKKSIYIFKFLINCKFKIYNGKRNFFFQIYPKHLFFKIGEFFFTKKRPLFLGKRKLKAKYRRVLKRKTNIKKKINIKKKK